MYFVAPRLAMILTQRLARVRFARESQRAGKRLRLECFHKVETRNPSARRCDRA
jgi:hypothetical protein